MQETIKVPQIGVPLGGPHNMRIMTCWGLNWVPMETGIFKIAEKRVPFQGLRDLGGRWNYDFLRSLRSGARMHLQGYTLAINCMRDS